MPEPAEPVEGGSTHEVDSGVVGHVYQSYLRFLESQVNLWVMPDGKVTKDR